MKAEFLGPDCPGRAQVQAHIQKIYLDAYGASVTEFAPLLVATRNASGDILCAAGIRTAADGFFSDTYLQGDFATALSARTGQTIAPTNIMEVVSLATATPFPVLAMLDAMIDWGRARGMSWGVFTATARLRRLLERTGLSYTRLCPADPAHIDDPQPWGRYYQTDPWVCAFSEPQSAPVILSPRKRRAGGDMPFEGQS